MSLKVCDITAAQLVGMDAEDINDRLTEEGFDLNYHYYTHTVGGSIHFEQWLDKASQLNLRNPHLDLSAITHHINAMRLA